jgi:hypothetical protein
MSADHARHVLVKRVTHGDSRSLTEQPAVLLTCAAAGPPGAATTFASRCSKPRIGRGKSNRAAAYPSVRCIGGSKPTDLSQLSHGLSGQHRTQTHSLDIRRILTCGYGRWRTRWTLSIGLRIRRLGFESLRARHRNPGHRPDTSSVDLGQVATGLILPLPAFAAAPNRQHTIDALCRHSPVTGQVRQPGSRSLQAGGPACSAEIVLLAGDGGGGCLAG